MTQFQLLVNVTITPEGNMLTSHKPATERDKATLSQLPSGGLVQGGEALVIEALRKEAYVMALSLMSKGQKTVTEQELDSLVRLQFLHLLEQHAPKIVEGTLKLLRSAQ